MRNLIASMIVVALMTTACTKNGTPTTILNERVDTMSAMAITQPGIFMSTSGHSVKGTARVYQKDNLLYLALENFSSTNGPDLHVYLSKEMLPQNFIDLGKLKSTTGNQVYDVPGMPDLNVYKYALIHCQQYNHLFGYTTIR